MNNSGWDGPTTRRARGFVDRGRRSGCGCDCEELAFFPPLYAFYKICQLGYPSLHDYVSFAPDCHASLHRAVCISGACWFLFYDTKSYLLLFVSSFLGNRRTIRVVLFILLSLMIVNLHWMIIRGMRRQTSHSHPTNPAFHMLSIIPPLPFADHMNCLLYR